MRQTRVWNINILLIMTFLGVWLPARAARAATELPEKNPVCWSKEACTEQYKAAGWCDDKITLCEGVVNWSPGEPNVCGVWGGCVPPGRAQLSIAFNGKTEVKDLGEYIKLIYAFLVGAAGVIAATLIIKGGFEYITAGGASERVGAAKKTIGSAVFGLLLVLASYTLLNTINPDLVHLRLPNVYMVRKIALGADWCKDANLGKDSNGKEKQFAEANVSYKDVTSLPGNWNITVDKTVCGKEYWIPDGEGSTCRGEICNVPKCEGYGCICTPKNFQDPKSKYECMFGQIGGKIIFEKGKDVKNIWLEVYCANGSVKEIQKAQHGVYKDLQGNAYNMTYCGSSACKKGEGYPVRGAEACGGDDQVLGYFFILEIGDNGGFTPNALNQNDEWMGGKSLCGVTSCPWYGKNTLSQSQAKDFMHAILDKKVALFSQAEMKKGITCNLNIGVNNFPNVGDPITFPCGIKSTLPPPP